MNHEPKACSLSFLRYGNPAKDMWVTGPVEVTDQIYLHHFGTGHQELIFTDTERARKFALVGGCTTFTGPTKERT